MPDNIIKMVEYWAKQDGQACHKNLAFCNCNEEQFCWDDDDDDEPLIEATAPEPNQPTATCQFPGIPLKSATPTPAVVPEDESTDEEIVQRVLTMLKLVLISSLPKMPWMTGVVVPTTT